MKLAVHVARLLWKHHRAAIRGALVGAMLAVVAEEWSPVVTQLNPNKEGQS